MSDQIQVVYLSYGLRVLALVVGAILAVRGATMLEKARRRSPRSGVATGSLGALSVTFRNSPVGSLLLLFGTIIIVTTLTSGPVRLTGPAGTVVAQPAGSEPAVSGVADVSAPILVPKDPPPARLEAVPVERTPVDAKPNIGVDLGRVVPAPDDRADPRTKVARPQ